MRNAITITGSEYTVKGTVKNKNSQGVLDLLVLVYDKDRYIDDFLGIGTTDRSGTFTVKFNAEKFRGFLDRKPDLYFIVQDAGLVLLNTKSQVIKNADESTPPINLTVNMTNDRLRKLINPTPVDGWVGGFAQSNPEFAYPNPNLSSLPILDNMANINLLTRQQKVVWPEFSWLTKPGDEDSRCFQMFAPDISRLGYNDEGRVYSIICPQQGFVSPSIGSINVEITVTGNRGWADEANNELAADMGVEGRIWFAPSALEKNHHVRRFARHFRDNKLPFPWNKENAIRVKTYIPGDSDQPYFPLIKGSVTDFKIPEFAKHEEISNTVAHLGVEIGSIVQTDSPIVNKFNQTILDVFNIASGNMLKEKNILTWNVWFTAPEYVDQEEWQNHAEYWRDSIEADHGSPEGPGTVARYFDGSVFHPIEEDLEGEFHLINSFIKEYILDVV